LRKAAIGLAILFFLVLAGLVVAPRFVDLSRLKGPLGAELAAFIGHPVDLRGPIGLSLLSGPMLTLRDLHVVNPPGATLEDMVRLRAVEVKVAFWPLLAGLVEVRSATLVEPEVDLERLANGAGNWQVGRDLRAGAAPDVPARALAIDRLTVEDGTITYRSGGTVERFEHIDARLMLGGSEGPSSVKGELATRGAAVSFEAESGPIHAAELPVRATLALKPQTRLELDAVLRGAGDDRRIAGKVKLVSDDFRALVALLVRVPLPPAWAQRLAVSADLDGSSQDIGLDHLAVDLGSAHGDGGLHLALGSPLGVGLDLSVGQVDLDGWLAPRKAALAPSPGSAFAATPDATAPVPLPAAAPDAVLALPQGIDLRLDIAVAAILWRKELIRDARLKAGLVNGEATVEKVTGLLPGGSEISLNGKAKIAGEAWRGLGVLSCNADDLRRLLAWLAIDADAVPADRLHKASLTSHFALAGDRIDLDGIDATVDATRMKGAATVMLSQRAGLGLRLSADNVNLDAYLPRDLPNVAADKDKLGAALDALDLNLDLHVDALTWRGQPLGNVHLGGTLLRGEATIRDFSIADAAGAAVDINGAVETPDGGSPKLELVFNAKGPELDVLLHLVAPEVATGFSYGDFHLGGTLSSDADKLAVDAKLDVLGGHAHLVGTVAEASGAPTLAVDLDHPSFSALVQRFSPRYRPAGGDPGTVKFSARLSEMSGRIGLDELALAVGNSTLEGKIDIDLTAGRPKVTADLKLGDWAIDRLIAARQTAAIDQRFRGLLANVVWAQARSPERAAQPWSTEPLDLAALSLANVDLTLAAHSLAYGRWHLDQPALTAALKDGTLTLPHLAGELSGGGLEASGEFVSAPKPSLGARVALRDADLRTALAEAGIGGAIDGRLDIDARIGSDGQSAAEMVSDLAGDITLRGRNGSIAGFDLKALSDRLAAPDRPADLLELLRSGAGGRTPFSAFEGSFQITDGIALGDNIRIVAEGGEGRGGMSLDLPRWTMASRIEFRLTGVPAAPPLTLHLAGAVDDPHLVFDVNALERYLAQRSSPQGPAAPAGDAGPALPHSASPPQH
jgi:uncharacterized protein involved in outer membrane biogenesis